MTISSPSTIPNWEIKRLLEYYLADPGFLEKMRAEPLQAAESCGVNFDPLLVQRLWDRESAAREDNPSEASYRQYINSKLDLRERIRREGEPLDPTYRSWRARQINRLPWELGPHKSESIIHAPFAVELCKGCSVGCWFCGIAAEKLREHFVYTPENSELWKGCLTALKDLMGKGAAKWGFCYWATDPLDNPDYEKFCVDFHDILGMFPQTTTALAHRDPARTRALLKLSQSKDCPLNRFSILTLGLFRKIFAEFSAEELSEVECLAQNKESQLNKAQAGKVRDKLKKQAEKAGEDFVDNPNGGTIACVSGFLLNMVERTLRLVTPCLPSDKWPLGYKVLEEGTFEDGPGLRQLLGGMVERRMARDVSDLPFVKLESFIHHEELEDGFQIASAFRRIRKTDSEQAEYLKLLGRALVEGTHPPAVLALNLAYQTGVPAPRTMATLQAFFEKGLLVEEMAS